jgi:rhodanese-related sulfurtransferase
MVIQVNQQANFFTQHGFEKVLSMDEGYSGWIKD